MEDKPNYYAIIPANVRYDNTINANSKLLYGEISALSNKFGYCIATNEYFSQLYSVSVRTITEWIKTLEKKNYIKSEIETQRYEDGTIKKIRKIYINHIEVLLQNHIEVLPQDHIEVLLQNHIEENFLYNNTSNINNINNNNNIYSKPQKITFGTYKRVKLTSEEYDRLVQEFGEEFINNQIQLLDEYIESNNNKNKYTNFNLVLRKSIRENWFNRKQPTLKDLDIDFLDVIKKGERK